MIINTVGNNDAVVARYPLPVRVGIFLVCVLLAIGVGRGSVHTMTIVATFGAICLAAAVLAYRAEVNQTEVRVRYAPFYTKRTRVQDITHLVEEGTVVLVTPTSRIPLWGLSFKAREALFRILPRHLDFVPSKSYKKIDPTVGIRRHQRWTIIAGTGFLVTAGMTVPFFKGNALHDSWGSVGNYVLLLCLCFFIAFIFEAGFTWVLWSTKRDIDNIEKNRVRSHRRA
jgi:hypothetical protein